MTRLINCENFTKKKFLYNLLVDRYPFGALIFQISNFTGRQTKSLSCVSTVNQALSLRRTLDCNFPNCVVFTSTHFSLVWTNYIYPSSTEP